MQAIKPAEVSTCLCLGGSGVFCPRVSCEGGWWPNHAIAALQLQSVLAIALAEGQTD